MTTIRDAAVNPLSKDFLEPINAGAPLPLGDPHGPFVVSPELHANEDVRPLVSGLVSSDPAVQEATEKASLVAAMNLPQAFAATTALALGKRVGLADGKVLEVSVAGTTGASAPVGPGSVGGTVVNGTATFKRIA